MNNSQLKLEVYDTYKKMKKMKTNIKAINDSDVIHKAYQDEKLLKLDDHLSLREKDHNEFKLRYSKQTLEEFLFQRAVKTTNQTLYDKRLFHNFPKAD